jgi:2-haloacid dehalogenase
VTAFRPTYLTFDCYGTLTAFAMSALTRTLLADRVPSGGMDKFLEDFQAFRADEVLGEYKPYKEVIASALRRTTRLWGVEHRDGDGRSLYQALPTWGAHPDVPGRWPPWLSASLS